MHIPVIRSVVNPWKQLRKRWLGDQSMANFSRKPSVVATVVVLGILSLISQWALKQDLDPVDAIVNKSIKSLLQIDPDEKFLWYSPHSGFGNQLVAFRNALRAAGILNRTLIVPPIFPHSMPVHLGDCAGGKTIHSKHIRILYWKTLLPYLTSSHYTSMADVVDISNVSTDLVRTIDLRIFLALKCGLDVSKSLAGCSWCPFLLKKLKPLWEAKRRKLWKSSFFDEEEKFQAACAESLGIFTRGKRVKSREKPSFFAVDRDCNTTIFVYSKDPETGKLSSRQDLNVEEKSCPDGRNFTFFDRTSIIRGINRRETLNGPKFITKNIDSLLGRGNREISKKTFLTFGSLFNYYDFAIPTFDPKIDALSCATEFLPFVPAVMKFSKAYSTNNISHPYLCSHFRGGDMFFRDLVHKTFAKLKKDLALFQGGRQSIKKEKNDTLFLITDLKELPWKKKIIREIAPLGYKVMFADNISQLYHDVKLMVANEGRGLLTNRVSWKEVDYFSRKYSLEENKVSNDPKFFANVDVVLEQVVCSCADLGFLGNPISSISKNIRQLRSGGACLATYN